jgi:hypothetical protein
LVARAFNGRDYAASYRAVMNYLRKELAEEPGLFESIGLALRDFDQVDEGGIYAIGPDYEDAWPASPVAPAK